MVKRLKDLPIGSIISDPRWKMYDEVIKFRKVADGHYTSDDTVLITDKIIKYMCFDAKEPNNSNSNRQKYGNNRYIHSNVRQWLNSAETNWYSAQHSADQAPNKDNVYSGYNPYDNIPGFLNNCPDDFIKAILNTNLEVVKSGTDGGGKESFTDKVFLPSRTEIGLGQENSLDDGKPIPYFNSNDRRKAVPTESAKKNNDDSNDYARYWLRTPYADYSSDVRYVTSDGSLYRHSACNGNYGVRPALRLDGSTLVESQGDKYVLKFNTPPVISGKNEDLGDIQKPFKYVYTVKDEDNDKMTVTEKLNNTVLKTHSNITSGTKFDFELSEDEFKKLEFDKVNKLTITVDDGKSTTTRTILFTRVARDVSIKIPNDLGEIYDLDFNFTVIGDFTTNIEFKLYDKVIYKKDNVVKDVEQNVKYDISDLDNKSHVIDVRLEVADVVTHRKLHFIKKEKTESRAFYNDDGVFKDYAVKYLTNGEDRLSFDDIKQRLDTIGNINKLKMGARETLVDAINDIYTNKYDYTNSPGGKKILVGNLNEGYFGTVPAKDLINGTELAKQVGLIEGTPQFSDTIWHKFAYEGKILFIPQKSIRHSISGDDLTKNKLVYGDTTISIEGVNYKIRLIKGATRDPITDIDKDLKYSEWNRLIGGLSLRSQDNSWEEKSYMENDYTDWKTYLTDDELNCGTGLGLGTGVWCQEKGEKGKQLIRNITNSTIESELQSFDSYGWRPVLEVVI